MNKYLNLSICILGSATAFFIYPFITVPETELLKVGLTLLLTATILLGYKVPLLGHFLKISTCGITVFKVAIPFCKKITGHFIPSQYLLLATVLIWLVLTAVFAFKVYANMEWSFWETKSFEEYHFNHRQIFKKWKPGHKKFEMEKYQLQMDKEILQSKERTLETEKYKFETAKRNFEREKENFEKEKQQFFTERNGNSGQTAPQFFAGCKSRQDARELHRALSKLLHPDCKYGNTQLFQMIQDQFDTFS